MKNKKDSHLFAIFICTFIAIAIPIASTYILDKNSTEYTVEYIALDDLTNELMIDETEATTITIATENTVEQIDLNGDTTTTEGLTTEATTQVVNSSELININTATAEELKTLSGIGDVLAAAIIEYRTETPFTSIEEIKNVSGIGDKKFEAIKDLICV